MRVRLISGIVAALLLVPAAASAGADGVCYSDPLDEVCVEDDEETDHVAVVPVSDGEVEVAQVVEASAELAETGIDTSAFLVIALGLLAAGGLMLRTISRRQSDTTAS